MSTEARALIVGGGIAGLAAAALLMRDAGWPGRRIAGLEQEASFGGSGNPAQGYVMRGGRMFEPHFGCPFDLFHGIPPPAEPGLSAIDEPHAFTRCFVTSSWNGLVRCRRRQEAPALQLPTRDSFHLARLALTREEALDAISMEPWFAPDFPASKFWFMWVSIFAFQSRHSLVEFRRQMLRFTHLLPGDRPQALRPGTRRLAFVGQFCELPEDKVFTVEYSVRSAPAAVYGLCDPSRATPPLYRG